MKKCVVVLFLLMVLSKNTLGQDRVFFDRLPLPFQAAYTTNPEISKVGWNRWTTKNFTILSIDENQGKYLFENIEQMKSWAANRWDLPDIDFSYETRIYCFPDAGTMKKLVGVATSGGETRTVDSKTVNYLWLLLDMRPAEVIPPALTTVYLNELERKYNLKLGWWVHRGMPLLNCTIPQIKNNILIVEPYFTNNEKMFFTKALCETTEEQWLKLPAQTQVLFDSESAMLCLLVRKEFGSDKFQAAIRSPILEKELGFENTAKFDGTLKRYLQYLSQDVKTNRTPDTYLQIRSKKE